MKTPLAMQFDDAAQQHEAATFGMWIFLATEVLFFGGLFLAYAVYRWSFPNAFAIASGKLSLAAGGINTAVLLTSSLTMALAIHAIQRGERQRMVRLLSATAALGAVFLGVKGYEYHHEWADHLIPWLDFSFVGAPAEHGKIFFYLYFFMTGLHALHLTIGIVVVSVLAFRSRQFNDNYFNPVEMTGLYWHFVDIVWVFLYPLLYLLHLQ